MVAVGIHKLVGMWVLAILKNRFALHIDGPDSSVFNEDKVTLQRLGIGARQTQVIQVDDTEVSWGSSVQSSHPIPIERAPGWSSKHIRCV